MFRISQYMQEIKKPDPVGSETESPPGPVVIWNPDPALQPYLQALLFDLGRQGFSRRAFLTAEVYQVMDDLKAFGVPVLILSGGEPLLRPDIFDISRRAKDMGFYVGLSTNGTLIDESNIDRIAAVGYDYVGISIDGLKATHDRFRRLEGAFTTPRCTRFASATGRASRSGCASP